MKMKTTCPFCKMEHARQNFERSRVPSNLSMYRLAVTQLELKIASNPNTIDQGCDKHQWATDERFRNWLELQECLAFIKQPVTSHISVR
jgi:hypothetical protein